MFGAIDAKQLRDKLGKVTLVDIRTPEEFSRGYIMTAISVRMFELDDLVGRIDPEREIVVYGHCARTSAVAAHRLVNLGFRRVNVLKGARGGWPYGVQRKAIVSE